MQNTGKMIKLGRALNIFMVGYACFRADLLLKTKPVHLLPSELANLSATRSKTLHPDRLAGCYLLDLSPLTQGLYHGE